MVCKIKQKQEVVKCCLLQVLEILIILEAQCYNQILDKKMSHNTTLTYCCLCYFLYTNG